MTLQHPAPLADHHIIESFESGVPSLDAWLKNRALDNQTAGATRTFVVCDEGRVIAYYALATGSIISREAIGRFRRNMPDPIPVVTLARLAVDISYQKHGLGLDLVQDAGRRVIAAADLIGIRGMIVHAISEPAKGFYLKCGFSQSPTNEMTLMVTLADLKAVL